MKYPRQKQKGFTIVEVAIVILVGGLFLATGLALLRAYLQQVEAQVTETRMQAIENAINAFYNVNQRLPCVASLTDAEDTPTYGVELTQAVSADCTTATDGGTFQTTGQQAGAPVQIGAVPVRSLNIPDQDMTDGWGDKFIYSVSANLASGTVPYDATKGAITVIDSAGNSVIPPLPSGTAQYAQYVLISHGQDRIGAWAGGLTPVTPCIAGTLESLNCAFSPAATPITFRKTSLEGVASGPSQYDDYVDFYTSLAGNGVVPSGTIMILDGAICPLGWLQPTFTSNPLPGFQPGPPFTGPWPVIYCEKQ